VERVDSLTGEGLSSSYFRVPAVGLPSAPLVMVSGVGSGGDGDC
jgi:hypothetical protein